MTAKRQWSGLTALLCLVILAAGFMFLVKPQHSKASSIKAETASVESQTASLRSQLTVLKDEQKNIVGEQAKLAAYEAQLPKDPQEPTLLRRVQEAAAASGVDLVALNPGNPTPFTPPSTGAAGTTAAAPATANLAVIPVSMSVSGSYADLEQFLDSLEGLQRSMLVNTFSLSYSGSSGAASGAAVGAGEIQANLTTQIFMAPSLGTPAAGSTAGTSSTGGTSAITSGGAATPAS